VLSLLLVLGVGLGLIWAVVEYFKTKKDERILELSTKSNNEEAPKEQQPVAKRKRVSSLDTFRGYNIKNYFNSDFFDLL